jgi:hypothetical protein
MGPRSQKRANVTRAESNANRTRTYYYGTTTTAFGSSLCLLLLVEIFFDFRLGVQNNALLSQLFLR